jgi:hypothetical protein
LEAGLDAPNEPANRAVVKRAIEQKINKLAHEYTAYTEELRRRYSIVPEEQQEHARTVGAIASAIDSPKSESANYPLRQHLLFAVAQQ